MFLFYVAALTLALSFVWIIDLAVGNRSIKALKDVLPTPNSTIPKISVIIAARNEEKNIREALLSVLSQNYPNLEFIVINDRSTDRTAEILASIAEKDPRLRVVEITELAKGWLGKNYALYRGAQVATGPVLLFMD